MNLNITVTDAITGNNLKTIIFSGNRNKTEKLIPEKDKEKVMEILLKQLQENIGITIFPINTRENIWLLLNGKQIKTYTFKAKTYMEQFNGHGAYHTDKIYTVLLA